MNNRFKHFIDFVLFIAILFGLLALTSYIIKPKGYDAYNLSVVNIKTRAIKAESNNSLDVLFVGNSESCYVFSPLQLWDEYGFTSYDTGSGAQRLADTYAILAESFKTQSPSLIVLESDSAMESDSGVYKSDDSAVSLALEKVFPILHYHSFYNGIALPKFIEQYTSNRKNEALYRGFQVWTGVNGADNSDHMAVEQPAVSMSETSFNILSDIKKLCDDNNCELLLVSAPSKRNWNIAKHNAISGWADANKVAYLDLNTVKGLIDWQTDTHDHGVHVNFNGSMKVNSYIGQYIKNNYTITDHRSDSNYASWDDDFNTAGLYTSSRGKGAQ